MASSAQDWCSRREKCTDDECKKRHPNKLCSYGETCENDECYYNHDEESKFLTDRTRPADSKFRRPCRTILRGFLCPYGDKCKYNHAIKPCREFTQNGECKRENCFYLHKVPTKFEKGDQVPYCTTWRDTGLCKNVNCPFNHATVMCRKQMNGGCTYSNCTFLHAIPQYPEPACKMLKAKKTKKVRDSRKPEVEEEDDEDQDDQQSPDQEDAEAEDENRVTKKIPLPVPTQVDQ